MEELTPKTDELLEEWSSDLEMEVGELQQKLEELKTELVKRTNEQGVAMDNVALEKESLKALHNDLFRKYYGQRRFRGAIFFGRGAGFNWDKNGRSGWIANAVGVLPKEETQIWLTLNDEIARSAIVPLYHPTTFNARMQQEGINKMYLSSVDTTEFTEESLDEPDIRKLLDRYCAEYMTTIEGHRDYYASIPPDDKARLAIVPGTLVYDWRETSNKEPTRTNTLADPYSSSGFKRDNMNIKLYANQHLYQYLGSKDADVIALGSMRAPKNPDRYPSYTLNLWGLWVDPHSRY